VNDVKRRLERLEKQRGESVTGLGGPMDPIQAAILEELAAYTPLNDQPEEMIPGIIRTCVGRALVDADLPPREIAARAPAYEELFSSYLEKADGGGDNTYP